MKVWGSAHGETVTSWGMAGFLRLGVIRPAQVINCRHPSGSADGLHGLIDMSQVPATCCSMIEHILLTVHNRSW